MIACIVRVATTVFVAGTLAGAGENQVGQGATMVWEVLIERPRHQVWTAVTTPDAVGSWLVGAVTVAATPGGRVVLSLGPDSDTYGARVVEVQEGVHLAAVIDRVPETSDHSGPLLGTRWTLSLSGFGEHHAAAVVGATSPWRSGQPAPPCVARTPSALGIVGISGGPGEVTACDGGTQLPRRTG